MKVTRQLHHRYFPLIQLLTIVLLFIITFYTLSLFFDLVVKQQKELFFYLIPSFILSALFFLMYKNEMLSGILFILLSFGFFLVYQISIASALFIYLLLIGILLLIDNHFVHLTIRKKHTYG